MKQVFKNVGEFDKHLQEQMLKAQLMTMEDLLDLLHQEIQGRVYDAVPEGKWYQRTYALLDNDIFKIDKPYYHGGAYGGIYGKIETDPSVFSKYQPPADKNDWQSLWQHRSNSKYESSLSLDEFIEIMNDGTNDIMFGFGRPETRFWDIFLFLAEKNYGKLFYANCKKVGLYLEEDGSSKNASGTIQTKQQRKKYIKPVIPRKQKEN